MNKVDVSIIIPVYNVQEYLSECLDSVINQTIKNKEIIIVNDGSTDNCSKILTEYKMKFPELIIINQKNRGISETRNAGLNAATGEYIAFVDSDDFIEKCMFERMYNAAKREKSDVVMCNYILYNEASHEQNTGKYVIEGNSEEGYINRTKSLEMFLINDIKGYVWNKLFKRELFIDNKILFPDFKVCEDTPVVFLLLAHSKKIFSMKEPLYYYRQREASLTKIYSIKSMEDMLKGCYIMRDYIKKDEVHYEILRPYYRVYLIKTLWAIHNKYFIQSCETGDKSNYSEFRKIVASEVHNLKICEILGNSKLKVNDKVNATLIKTKTYGLIFSILYKLRNIVKYRRINSLKDDK
ncbi:glycosyltransferase family 2 protein [Clostridium sp.]|uniref:glycosyltransferase family 2 protein n=1 Tax=Clostridium sp. TaxID=1506 RepID=UPI003D6D7D65